MSNIPDKQENADSSAQVQKSVSATQPSRFPSLRLPSFSKLKTPAVVFPPPSWALEEEMARTPGDESGTETPTKPVPPAEPPVDDDLTSTAPEPVTLAQTIRNLIDSLPSVSSYRSVETSASTEVDPRGPPVPDGVDKKLATLLSSETVMNGYNAGKESVFAVLDRVKHKMGKNNMPKTEGSSKDTAEEDYVGNEGIMMYTPLVPTNDSHVELAEEETELEYIDREELESKIADGKQETDKTSGESKAKLRFWMFGRERNEAPTPNQHGVSEGGTKDEIKPHRVWVPSETRLSVQVMWWGYRIYLPPPVIQALDSGHIVATKRAAMITAALKWMLDKIPQMMVPPALRPALALFKRLAPYLGYIGVFIAWSWKSIKAHDKGAYTYLTLDGCLLSDADTFISRWWCHTNGYLASHSSIDTLYVGNNS